MSAIQNIHLKFTFTYGVEQITADCQIIDLSLRLPGVATGQLVETACPDGRVLEPGSPEAGALTGNVFADPTDTGITWALAHLKQSGEEFDYTATWWADAGVTKAMEFTGTAQVASFQLDWSKPGMGKHPVDISLVSAAISRPAA